MYPWPIPDDPSSARKGRHPGSPGSGVGVTGKRQHRQSREELRALLLETGRRILREQGLSSGAETLTFKTVFDRVEEEAAIRVTNGSVIGRVWENQAEFQADVLVTIALDDHHEQIDFGLEAARSMLNDVDLSTLCSPSGRAARSVPAGGRAQCTGGAQVEGLALVGRRVGPGRVRPTARLPQEDRIGSARRVRWLHRADRGCLCGDGRVPRVSTPETVHRAPIRHRRRLTGSGIRVARSDRPFHRGSHRSSDWSSGRNPGLDPARSGLRGPRAAVLRDRPGLAARPEAKTSVAGADAHPGAPTPIGRLRRSGGAAPSPGAGSGRCIRSGTSPGSPGARAPPPRTDPPASLR